MAEAWAEARRVAAFAALDSRVRRWDGEGVVLDLGCGPGLWLSRMAGYGLSPVGLEPDRGRIREARHHAPVVVAEGATLPFRDASVGLVWCLQVLHHLESPQQVLAEIRRVLRPGGQLLLSESVEDSPAIRAARSLWPQWEGVPVRSRFHAAELGRWVTDADLHIVEYRQHCPASLVALVMPRGGRTVWRGLQWLEQRFPGLSRRGAYVDCVACRARDQLVSAPNRSQ